MCIITGAATDSGSCYVLCRSAIDSTSRKAEVGTGRSPLRVVPPGLGLAWVINEPLSLWRRVGMGTLKEDTDKPSVPFVHLRSWTYGADLEQRLNLIAALVIW